ncbi:DUF2867 domain-containing protein [Mycolicibacterium sp. XJ1819]
MFRSGAVDTAEHTAQPWRIHQIADDFQVLDVWALPTPGGPEDFPRLVDLLSTFEPRQVPVLVRALLGARTLLGKVFRLDQADTGLGARVPTLRDRLPADLRDASTSPGAHTTTFVPLYRTDDEAALEIANRTMHGVVHLGWVAEADEVFRGQLAILVRPNGTLGIAYLKAIAPFRHLIVYPMMMRAIAKAWRE